MERVADVLRLRVIAARERREWTRTKLARYVRSSDKTIRLTEMGKTEPHDLLRERLERFVAETEAMGGPTVTLLAVHANSQAVLGALQLAPKMMQAIFGDTKDPALSLESSGLHAQSKGVPPTHGKQHEPEESNAADPKGQRRSK